MYTYTYDAENRILSANVSGTYYCYIYDGNGLRVAKATSSSSTCSSPTVYEIYWRSVAGQTIAVTDGSGSTTNSSYHEYIFFAGRRVARSDPSSGNVYYLFVDQIGSTRAMTDQSGNVCFQMDYLPYGEENTPAGANNTCSTSYLFTGYERDSETGLDYAFARYYNSREARFMTTDPLGGDITDPQTLNKYAYVRNNPTNLIDPLGLCGGSGNDPEAVCGPPEPPVIVTGAPLSFGPVSPITSSTPFVSNWRPMAIPPPPPPPKKPQTPQCTAARKLAGQIGETLHRTSEDFALIAGGGFLATGVFGAAEVPSGGVDTGFTITAGGVTALATDVAFATGGLSAALNSFANGNSGSLSAFDVSRLAGLTATLAASKLPVPFVGRFAETLGYAAEQASSLVYKAKDVCK